jgi:hypothetical protein
VITDAVVLKPEVRTEEQIREAREMLTGLSKGHWWFAVLAVLLVAHNLYSILFLQRISTSLVVTIFVVFLAFWSPARIGRKLRSVENHFVLTPKTLKIEPWINGKRIPSTTRLPWSKVASVVEEPDAVVLYPQGGGHYRIPNSCFPTEKERATLLALARGQILS